MGLLGRLFGGQAPSGSQSQSDEFEIAFSIRTEERINVVGESHYQPAIRKACGWKRGTDTLFECMAELVPEPTNRYDPNAVMVKVDGRQVGYLSHADAKELGAAVREGIERQGSGMCRAVIAGHADGHTQNLGVFLHLDVSRELG
jgi:hypothetical protein